MKKLLVFVCAALAAACGPRPAEQTLLRPSEYVSTLVGTQSDYALSTGNTYPAVALPWGMNFWTPQTGRMGDGWAYTYGAHTLCGFKQTHQPSPWINDYAPFSLMPVRGDDKLDEQSRRSWFSHQSEEARPYYYRVYLADHDVRVEIAPTERAAVMRFTFPESDESGVVVDAFDRGSRVEVVDARTLAGYTTRNSGGVPDNFRNWFVIRFDKPFGAVELTDSPSDYAPGSAKLYPEGGKAAEGCHAVAKVHFTTRRGEQAVLNLDREVGDATLDQIRSRAQERWDEVLGRIEVAGGKEEQLRTFYSCLYRSTLFPRKFYELDAAGEPVHYSPYNGEVLPGYMYTDTGFWDTFRCLFPLLNLVYPSENAKMQAGLANAWRESGFLPEWASPGHRGCMVGNNSASIVAEAWLNGLRGFDEETIWEAVVHGANNVHPQVASTGRLGHEYYNKLGYVPYNVGINESAARTLEYAYDDWCIYQLGKALGKSEKELKPYAQRAMNYKNLFDKEHNLMRGRNEDGTFQSPFNPLKWGDAFTEGNSWHYSWSVFHDPQGLINLMGGKETFNQMMDSVMAVPPLFDDSYYGGVIHEIREMQIMNMGNYAHGNQPVQHMLYLYNYSGQPWKTQKWVREVMDKMYLATPDGYCGDEDNGQTSAWYVFSAMGFYPVCPGSGEYIIGTPLFKKMTLNLENGHKIVITAPDNSRKNCYVDAVMVNGAPYDLNYFTHEQLNRGAYITFDMSDKPNTLRGSEEKSFPYSFSNELKQQQGKKKK